MKISHKLFDYELKNQENDIINEKINFTTKNYFYLVNNYTKDISKIEDQINLLNPKCPIKINELIYNQHIIIKDLISLINKKEKECQNKIKESIENINNNKNNVENHIISFNIISSNKNITNNNYQVTAPLSVYKKKITLNTNSSNRMNISFSKNEETCNTLEKKIINSLNSFDNDYSLKKQINKFNNFVPITEKIKKESIIKIRNFNNFPSKETFENLKYRLKYKYYKPSFLNSFVSGKKIKNNNKYNRVSRNNSSDLKSTNKCSCEIKREDKKYKNVSYFIEENTVESKNNGIRRINSSFDDKDSKMNNSIYNLKIVDDTIVNNFLDRTNSKSKPKVNKYVKNLYQISNEIVNKYQKKIFND